jgi:hypothetical protein
MTDKEWQALKDKTNKQRKPSRHLESKLQQSCVTWFRLQYPKYILFAIPNGGKRSKVEAKIMNGEGVLAGVADLFLMCPRKGYCGLFIEMKYGEGKQSDNQELFEINAEAFGYKYVIADSFDRFRIEINNYLK